MTAYKRFTAREFIMDYKIITSGIIVSLLSALMAMPVHATDSQASDKWEFGAEVYLWGASIDAKPTGGENIHISFSDIMDNLDTAIMGTLVARNGRWSLFSDIIHLDIEDEQKGTVSLLDIPIKTDFDVEMKAWIVTSAGAYTVLEKDRFSLDLLAGARYFWLDIPIKARVGSDKVKTSPSGHLWDGILGVRGEMDISDNWYLTYYLDAGTGDSDFTWQGSTSVNYRFKRFVASAGYRYLDWDIDNKTFDSITVKGPYAGVKYFF